MLVTHADYEQTSSVCNSLLLGVRVPEYPGESFALTPQSGGKVYQRSLTTWLLDREPNEDGVYDDVY